MQVNMYIAICIPVHVVHVYGTGRLTWSGVGMCPPEAGGGRGEPPLWGVGRAGG